jgi:hypothetical protein
MEALSFKPPDTIRHPKKRAFLKAFARCGAIRRACAAAGIHHSTIYEWRKSDAEFADAVDVAKQWAIETLEMEADRRAVDGVPRMKFHKGKPLIDPDTGKPYVEYEYSDSLLMFRLKRLDPAYRENYKPSPISDAELNAEIERTLDQLKAKYAAEPCPACSCPRCVEKRRAINAQASNGQANNRAELTRRIGPPSVPLGR